MDKLPAPLLDQVVQWRRYLHQHPELSFQEHQTAAYLRAQLEAMPGLEVSQLTPTSVLAVLRGAAGPGRTVLLRADIDALPITEDNTFEYRSQTDGIMHACGHDGHAAMLLAAAHMLSEERSRLSGEIRFIFQHAEEQPPGGAEELVFQTPLMDGVDLALGLHLLSMYPAGTVLVRAGEFMASPDSFQLTIRGKGGHGGMPELTVDPIAVAAQVVTNLQHVVSRNVSPFDPLVVSVTQFHAGTADNVIPETARLAATVRVFSPELREQAPQLLERIIAGICAAHGAEYDFEYLYAYRPVVNTDWVADELTALAREVVGPERVQTPERWAAGEDFSAYLQKAPGCYFAIGSGSPETDSEWPHHHPRFTLDESALETGVLMLTAAARHFTQPAADDPE
ncbi:amidohydrolase [Deinococcus radiophilus]|uniref:Amidohydrolase n=1 Tax=Deinococcus radiophilus TaxID=32062 RepID=A0A431VVN7_9DEIO|nr:amidohydrolase [Deinococcus radiophilus]RTR27079.1 amidohydrolase [Deinococcus radiophilus]UFA50138.1 amidohydrolase [Deinococcus radiophilus]